jgi:hypothetical protein
MGMHDPTPPEELDYFNPEAVFEPNLLETHQTVAEMTAMLEGAGYTRDETLTKALSASIVRIGQEMILVSYDGDSRRYKIRRMLDMKTTTNNTTDAIVSAEGLSRQPNVRTSTIAQENLQSMVSGFRKEIQARTLQDADVDELFGRE